MKTARRQELRTNELSVQIDQITEQVKQNYTTILTIVLAVTVVAGGIYWYVTSTRNRLMEGWATLSVRGEQSDPERDISKFNEVISQNLDPKLNAAAYMKIGEAAMGQYTWPSSASTDAAPVAGDAKWLDRAQSAYTSALASNVLDQNAQGAAMIHLGIIAENKGDFEKASEMYRRVTNDAKFAGTPFYSQADYRLKNVEQWKTPIVFAPPPPKPQPTTAAASQPANPIVVPAIPQIVPEEAPKTPPPAPTTQPAG